MEIMMDVKESKLEAEFFLLPDSSSGSGSPDFKYAGPFRIGRFLGKGTSGTAFVGTHIESGFKAALKAIKKSNLAKKPARWKQLRREIAVMKLMDHPNILKLYDVFETEDRIWMVTELARGGELFDYLQRGIPSRKTCLRFLAQITMGLLHCHQHGIAHRDLKPENLLLDERLNIKVADFGMARFTTKGTFMNTTCGSPHYVSPEVIAGKYEGKTSDVWSLGVILYALTTGCLPFDHESIPELLKLIQAGVFTIPGDVDDDITDLIRRMMQVDVKDRILMEDIHTHHAFTGTWYFSKPSAPLDSPERTINSHSLDELVFEDVIALLGSDARDEVRAKVVGTEDCLEKALYRLLINRKQARLASLHRLSPKLQYRTVSAPASPAPSAPTQTELPPTFDLLSDGGFMLGGKRKGARPRVPSEPQVSSTSISASTSKNEVSETLSQTFRVLESPQALRVLESPPPERKDIRAGLTDLLPTLSPGGKVASTPTFTRRLSSHSKMETSHARTRSGGASSETKPMSISPEPHTRRIFIQLDQPTGDSIITVGPRDLKPSPVPSPFASPNNSPYGSPKSSPGSSRSPSPAPPSQSSPSSRGSPINSPVVTRPWFAAFFKRRPSLDPYKPEGGSGSGSGSPSSVRASILNRLRAKSTQPSPRRIFQMEVDQTARSSPRGVGPEENRETSPVSPKLTQRLDGLLRAAQVQQQQSGSLRKPALPVLREEGETSRVS